MSTFRSITPRQRVRKAAAIVWERFGAGASRLVAAFIARRAERRLLRELAGLDPRLLDDIGTDRVGHVAGRHGHVRQAQQPALPSS